MESCFDSIFIIHWNTFFANFRKNHSLKYSDYLHEGRWQWRSPFQYHAIPMENLNLDFNDLKANVLAYVYM